MGELENVGLFFHETENDGVDYEQEIFARIDKNIFT